MSENSTGNNITINGGIIGGIGNQNVITQNIDNRSLNGINIEKLKEELETLKEKLVTKELYLEAGAIKSAIVEKEDSKIIGFLKSAGKCSFEIAKEIGLSVAQDAIKKSLGV